MSYVKPCGRHRLSAPFRLLVSGLLLCLLPLKALGVTIALGHVVVYCDRAGIASQQSRWHLSRSIPAIGRAVAELYWAGGDEAVSTNA